MKQFERVAAARRCRGEVRNSTVSLSDPGHQIRYHLGARVTNDLDKREWKRPLLSKPYPDKELEVV